MTEPVEEFAFEEDTSAPESANYTWSNAASAISDKDHVALAEANTAENAVSGLRLGLTLGLASMRAQLHHTDR